MQSYEINHGKRKKAIKQVVKANVKNAKGIVKFCHGLTWFLRILAVILGLANILYVVFLSSYVVDIIFLIMTFGFPYGLSFLSAIVYIISAGGEYRLRRRETITFAMVAWSTVITTIVLVSLMLFSPLMFSMRILASMNTTIRQKFLPYMEKSSAIPMKTAN